MPEAVVQRQRWYDRMDGVTVAVERTQSLPDFLQAKVAEYLNALINTELRLKNADAKSDQKDIARTLGLYGSYGKKGGRWYDTKPFLHRAFSLMASVPEPRLRDFSQRVIRLSNYVRRLDSYMVTPSHTLVSADYLLQEPDELHAFWGGTGQEWIRMQGYDWKVVGRSAKQNGS